MSNERKPHKHCEVIKQWADGKQIQSCPANREGAKWQDVAEPRWYEDQEYRVKPESYIVWYRVAIVDTGEKFSSRLSRSPEDAAWMERQEHFIKWASDWQEVEIQSA